MTPQSASSRLRNRAQLRAAAPAACLLLTLLPLAGCQQPAPPSAPRTTTITIGPEVLHTGVKRLGINLSGQTFYDSAQLLRNLTFRNPGFEGESWQSILRCKTVTPTACTDENQYTVWPANFLAGAHFEDLASGSSGTVASTSAAANGLGVTVTLANPSKPPSAGDFLLLQLDKPGGADAGWWMNLQAGASVATEFRDLSPHSPGKQALRIDAAGSGQSAAVHSYFDSTEGRSFLQLRGRLTLSFRAKRLASQTPTQRAGPPSRDTAAGSPLTVSIERLDTTHGRHSFFAKSVPLTSAWQDYTYTFTADERRDAVGTIDLAFLFAGTSALLDDVALTADADPGNPTAFRNEVVQTLRTLRPGVLRYMDNGTDFGSSLDNMLAPPFARRRSGASTQETLREDIPVGLHEFLALANAVGAEPWYSMPPGTSRSEAAALIEYLSGAPSTRYGAIRAKLGQPAPWTSVFSSIHLELGNEQWNARSFAGATIADPTAYGRRAAEVFSAMRAAPGFQPRRFDLILGSWAAVPWWTGQELASSSGFDSVALAPYLFNDFNDASSGESIFGPMFAQPQQIDSTPGGSMAQQAAAVAAATHETNSRSKPPSSTGPAHLAVYEVNLGAMTGTVDQAAIDRTVPSLGAGLAVVDHMLLMLRDLGITTQCLFALPEFSNNFTSTNGGPRRSIPLWGAVVDMGGPTDLRRPQFLAEQLANRAILPTEVATHVAGPPHTWNQPESSNDKVKLKAADELQTFAFVDGPLHTLILLNLSRTDSLPVLFAGPARPPGQLEQSLLTSGNITDNNEHTSTVSIQTRILPSLDPSSPYSLPPHSMTVLAWHTATR